MSKHALFEDQDPLFADGPIIGTGGDDDLVGTVEDDWIYGLGGNDHLFGDSGKDRLYGGSGDDVLHGNQGNDKLFSGAGSDSLFGGAGDDRLTGGVGGDRLWGEDGNDVLHGDQGSDYLDGDVGDDTLCGGEGRDWLSGGSGSDTYVFDTALAVNNIDKIFFSIEDTIQLSSAIFSVLPGGQLDPAFFAANAEGDAVDADDHILFGTHTGKLFYDADGSGAGEKVQFALIDGTVQLSVADFLVV